ncbi:MAG: DUF72 domain-containing protein, partial [Thermoleophilaceae bacterium]
MAGRIVVGTSSWADPGFVEDWYPEGMPARDRLPWYAERFEAVEVNATFYGVPAEATVVRWVEATPEDFSFDVKLHRLLSRHSAGTDSLPKDLREEVETNERGRVRLTPELEAEVLDRTIAALAPLEKTGKLSSLLLQLTPSFSPGRHSLDELSPLIERAAPRRVAVELRHRSWMEGERAEETLRFLSEAGAVYVAVDAPLEEHVPIMPPIDAVTRDDLAYLRAHGRDASGYLTGKTVAERFGWRYADDELEEIARRTRMLAEDADEVRMMFNNNRSDDAPTAAQRFRQLLGQDPGPPPTDPQQRL